jgi:hypothetical protein
MLVMKLNSFHGIIGLMFLVIIVANSCSKGGGGNNNPCDGVTVTVTGTPTSPSVIGASDGSISVSASGGSGFTYSVNGGAFQSGTTFTGLPAGSYSITAKNSNGCTGSATVTITAPPNPCNGVTITVTGSVTNPTGAGATNGSIAASASGGTGPYTFSNNGGAFQSSGTFSNLAAGSYTITARTAAGCTGSATFNLADPNLCSGVTININNATTNSVPCGGPGGSITVSASGGLAPYTYSINGTSFQTSNVFSNLTNGSYSVVVRDANSCSGTSGATAINNAPAGPLFTQVRNVLQANCVSCHNNTVANGGMNWAVDCNIVTFKSNIQARAVNGSPSPMPPTGLLPASERQKITDWINAGGRYSD